MVRTGSCMYYIRRRRASTVLPHVVLYIHTSSSSWGGAETRRGRRRGGEEEAVRSKFAACLAEHAFLPACIHICSGYVRMDVGMHGCMYVRGYVLPYASSTSHTLRKYSTVQQTTVSCTLVPPHLVRKYGSNEIMIDRGRGKEGAVGASRGFQGDPEEGGDPKRGADPR